MKHKIFLPTLKGLTDPCYLGLMCYYVFWEWQFINCIYRQYLAYTIKIAKKDSSKMIELKTNGIIEENLQFSQL